MEKYFYDILFYTIAEAIKDAILKLYNNQEFLKKISENIEKEYFKGDRSWDNSSAKFLQAFNSIRNQK